MNQMSIARLYKNLQKNTIFNAKNSINAFNLEWF